MISMLIIQSLWDCRFRQIPIGVTILGGIVGLLWSVWQGREWGSVFMAILPGVIALGIGWITREAIGYGDGFLLCAMGAYLPMDRVIGILMLACLLAGGVGLFLIISGRKKGKDTLPFVPFLLVATVIEVILSGRY